MLDDKNRRYLPALFFFHLQKLEPRYTFDSLNMKIPRILSNSSCALHERVKFGNLSATARSFPRFTFSPKKTTTAPNEFAITRTEPQDLPSAGYECITAMLDGTQSCNKLHFSARVRMCICVYTYIYIHTYVYYTSTHVAVDLLLPFLPAPDANRPRSPWSPYF